MDFIFFDYDVFSTFKKGKVKEVYSGDSYGGGSTSDVVFEAHSNGLLTKNGLPFLDDDILVVFEDDADPSIKNVNATLLSELSDMNADLLYLGWCDCRALRPQVICTQAYAMTRRGARTIVKNYETCGDALDIQLAYLCRSDVIKCRTVHAWNIKNFNANYPREGDRTKGMFHQKGHTLGSVM